MSLSQKEAKIWPLKVLTFSCISRDFRIAPIIPYNMGIQKAEIHENVKTLNGHIILASFWARDSSKKRFVDLD